MRLFDTHAHFTDKSDVDGLLGRAAEAGIVRVLAVGGSRELNRNALRTPCRVALGWDRDQTDVGDGDFAELRHLVTDNARRVAAIGEIGLDFHYSPESAAAQKELFASELALADSLSLPVVIHTREADEATLEVIDSVPWSHESQLRGVIHSYTGGPDFAGKLLDRGFMISFSGIVTFRSADLVRESARFVPDDRILVETDTPFLAPVPLRGHQCEPAYVVHTAKCIAAERKTDIETFADLTFANSEHLLGTMD
jgi:TatD DNase family protein